jgi:hypothetical protein
MTNSRPSTMRRLSADLSLRPVVVIASTSWHVPPSAGGYASKSAPALHGALLNIGPRPSSSHPRLTLCSSLKRPTSCCLSLRTALISSSERFRDAAASLMRWRIATLNSRLRGNEPLGQRPSGSLSPTTSRHSPPICSGRAHRKML